MYNIAEQTGAAARHIFVWSANDVSFPQASWNRIENYYPGDQYVDWVGTSCYPHSPASVTSADHRYPVRDLIVENPPIEEIIAHLYAGAPV